MCEQILPPFSSSFITVICRVPKAMVLHYSLHIINRKICRLYYLHLSLTCKSPAVISSMTLRSLTLKILFAYNFSVYFRLRGRYCLSYTVVRLYNWCYLVLVVVAIAFKPIFNIFYTNQHEFWKLQKIVSLERHILLFLCQILWTLLQK